jgi:hypothetical protein
MKMTNYFWTILRVTASTLLPREAVAEVIEVRVGVTPNCPYGFPACWASAEEGLRKLPGVLAAPDAIVPDFATCTAKVLMKGGRLPDLAEWQRRFPEVVGKAHLLRGVEVTIEGVAYQPTAGELVLRAPGLAQPVALDPLRSSSQKLQWNFKSHSAVALLPVERDQHRQLLELVRAASPGAEVKVRATGLLNYENGKPRVELREFSPAKPKS